VEAIKTILEQAPNILPIACGGGGIPVSRIPSNPQTLSGVEAVIDKDACGAKLANELEADGFIILTDGGGIWQNFGKPNAREMKKASPGKLCVFVCKAVCWGLSDQSNLHNITLQTSHNY